MSNTAVMIDNDQWYQLLKIWQSSDEYPDRLYNWLRMHYNIISYDHGTDPGYCRLWFGDRNSAVVFRLKF